MYRAVGRGLGIAVGVQSGGQKVRDSGRVE